MRNTYIVIVTRKRVNLDYPTPRLCNLYGSNQFYTNNKKLAKSLASELSRKYEHLATYKVVSISEVS